MNTAQLMRWGGSLVVTALTTVAEVLPHGSTAYTAITAILGIAGNIGIHAIPAIGQTLTRGVKSDTTTPPQA